MLPSYTGFLSHLEGKVSRVCAQLCPTFCDLMDYNCQVPLSMEFSRQ